MCVIAIVDTDSLLVLATRHGPGDDLFLSWIENGHGILAFSETGLYPDEVLANRAILELFLRYEQGGQMKKIEQKKISIAENQIRERSCVSDDQHILALALASGTTVLCSNDKKLRLDFKNKDVIPSTRQKPRVLYPIGGNRSRRRQFLNRHRCANRKRT